MHVREPVTGTMAQARRGRSTQVERSARTRSALVEAAAKGLSRYGYGNLVLEEVAREAGYTRGALYHQFKDKEDLALAVVDWADKTWWHEVGEPAERQPDPVAALVELCARQIEEGRRSGSIPAGPPANAVARAFLGAVAGAVIALAGQAPHDELLAARAGAGVLGLGNSQPGS